MLPDAAPVAPRFMGAAAMYDSTADAGRKRLVSGVLAAGLQVGLALVLVYGLAAPALRTAAQIALTSLDLRTPPPPPPPKHPAASRRAAPAAPPARHALAAPFVAPRTPPLKPPPPLPVAPAPGQGMAAEAGAASTGNGIGAGGSGAGSGAGGTGDGDGGGSDPELVGGEIKSSDTPEALRQAPLTATVQALVSVDAAGKVSDCRTQKSSGNATLDDLTCRLIQKRFRFHPARDAGGQAVAAKIIYEQEWHVGGRFDSDPP